MHGGLLAITRYYQEWQKARLRRREAARTRQSEAGQITAADEAHRYRERMRAEPRLGDRAFGAPQILHVIKVFLTFQFVCATWIFFRSPSFSRAWLMVSQISTLTHFHPNLAPTVLAVLAVGLATHWAPERWYVAARQTFIRLPAPAQGVTLFCAALVLRDVATAKAVPFVYFQF